MAPPATPAPLPGPTGLNQLNHTPESIAQGQQAVQTMQIFVGVASFLPGPQGIAMSFVGAGLNVSQGHYGLAALEVLLNLRPLVSLFRPRPFTVGHAPPQLPPNVHGVMPPGGSRGPDVTGNLWYQGAGSIPRQTGTGPTARLDWLHLRRQQLRDMINGILRESPNSSGSNLQNLREQASDLTREIAEETAILRRRCP